MLQNNYFQYFYENEYTMTEKNEVFKEKLTNIVNLSEDLELKNFTYDVIDCLYVDLETSQFDTECTLLVEGYVNEIENSLEIMNPDLKIDIELLENLLVILEEYLEKV